MYMSDVRERCGRGKQRTGEPADVPCPLDDCELEAEADTEERDLLFARPLDGEHHAFRATYSETSWYEDTAVGMRIGYEK